MAASRLLLSLAFSLIFGVLAQAEEEVFDASQLDRYELAPPYFTCTKKAEYYILPILKYSEELLEPFIDRATLEAHYLGHHNAYRVKLNTALKEWREEFPDDAFARESIIAILSDLDRIPDKYYTAIVNNGGGFVNHALYWGCLMPNLEENPVAREPSGALREEIERDFGSYEAFREEFTKQALAKFGSGYVWLVRNPHKEQGRQLSIVDSDNQGCPLSVGEKPLLVIDIWEHAYYLKHQFRRAKYVEDWWMLVDWELVAELDDFWRNDMQLAGDKYQRKVDPDVKAPTEEL